MSFHLNPNQGNKWFVPTNDSVFQKIKIGAIPLFIAIIITAMIRKKGGKYGKFNFLKNKISGVIGVLIYLFVFILLLNVWSLINEENDNTFDMVAYVISIIIGIATWSYTSKLIVAKRLDNFSLVLLLFILVWFITCSYGQCPEFYGY